MKLLHIVFILSFFTSLQYKVFAGSFSDSTLASTSESSHSHEAELDSGFEFIEVLLTGKMAHSHDHHEHDEESHSHSHQHHFGGSLSSNEFLFSQIQLSFQSVQQSWLVEIKRPRPNPFYFEILRPPIVECAFA